MARQHPDIGKKIRFYRTHKGWSQRELARQSGVAFSLISRWERGAATPTYEKACEVAEALEVPVAWIWDHGSPPTLRGGVH